MKTVFKYQIVIADEQIVSIPQEAEILCCKVQYGGLAIWARIDPERLVGNRKIYIRGTGHPCDNVGKYIDTCVAKDGALVWHVFDGGEV